jgi:hypothetical protein
MRRAAPALVVAAATAARCGRAAAAPAALPTPGRSGGSSSRAAPRTRTWCWPRCSAGRARPSRARRRRRRRSTRRGAGAAAQHVPAGLHPGAGPLAPAGGAGRRREPAGPLQPEHAQGRQADLRRGLVHQPEPDLGHVYEPRSTPVPVGIQSGDSGSNDVFGDTEQTFFSETLIASAALIKGDTAFRPQDIELRLTLAYQYNYANAEERRFLEADPGAGTERQDSFLGVQEAFLDYHIRNVSDRYDFDSVRVGIQPFSTDFRGFLFQDNQLGVRCSATATTTAGSTT